MSRILNLRAVLASTILLTVGSLALAAGAVTAPATPNAPSAGVVSASNADISGPCDEAEHAGDLRCATTPAQLPPAPTTQAPTQPAPIAQAPTTQAPTTQAPTTQAVPASPDISGPCDEAEHANEARCAGSAVTTTAPSPTGTAAPTQSPSTTTTVNPAPSSAEIVGSVDAADAGVVAYSFDGQSFSLTSASPNAGWIVSVERSGGVDIEVKFELNNQRVDVEIQMEHGGVKERVRVRKDR